MNNQEEGKRKYNRFQFASPVPASFTVLGNLVHIPGMDEIKCEIVDVSNGGMKIRIESKPPEKGSVIRILLPIPVTSDIQTTVPVLTLVVWVETVSDKTYSFGVMFMK